MKPVARVGDPALGGLHCHGHSHGPLPSPGRITQGASKVFIDGLPAARVNDKGMCTCCGGSGTIVVQMSGHKVIVEGQPIATVGTQTLHCGMGLGLISGGSGKVFVV